MPARGHDPRRRSGAPRQRGGIAVAFAILSVLLLAFVGLGTDVGRLYVSRTELQNAADACVLAAAAALTGMHDDQLRQAEAWGIAAGTANRVGMQSAAASLPRGSAVTFARSLQDAFLPAGGYSRSSDIRGIQYVRCTVTESDIAPGLSRVLALLPGGEAIGTRRVTASASGTLRGTPANCSLPVGICRQSNASEHGLRVGDWIIGTFSNGNLGVRRAFRWVGFPGATRVSDLEAQLSDDGQCALVNTTSTVVPHSGLVASLIEGWNMRFGLQRNNPDIPVLPDMTGYYYMPPTRLPPVSPPPSRYADFERRRARYESGDDVSTPSGYRRFTRPGGTRWTSSNQHRATGTDRRMAIAPIIDCDNLRPGVPTPVLDWSCVLLLHPVQQANDPLAIEYRGRATDPASGCRTTGLPADGGPRVPVLTR
jgi:Flp pilus assembly protein TadG